MSNDCVFVETTGKLQALLYINCYCMYIYIMHTFTYTYMYDVSFCKYRLTISYLSLTLSNTRRGFRWYFLCSDAFPCRAGHRTSGARPGLELRLCPEMDTSKLPRSCDFHGIPKFSMNFQVPNWNETWDFGWFWGIQFLDKAMLSWGFGVFLGATWMGDPAWISGRFAG